MRKEEENMLKNSLEEISKKLQRLSNSASKVRSVIGSLDEKLLYDEPVLEAIRLMKFKFVDQTGEFDGTDVELLDPEDYKRWNAILGQEIGLLKRIDENKKLLLLYKAALDDVEEDINGLNNRYTETHKKLHSERYEEEQQSEPVEPERMSRGEKILLLIIVVLCIGMFFIGSIYVDAGILSGWLLIVPAAFIIAYIVFMFISDDMSQTNYGYY